MAKVASEVALSARVDVTRVGFMLTVLAVVGSYSHAEAADFVTTIALAPIEQTNPEISQAIVLARRGKLTAAVDILDGLLRADGGGGASSGIVEFVAGRLLERGGRFADAADRYGKAGGTFLGDEALYAEGRLRLKLGDVSRARAALGAITRASSNWVPARLALTAALEGEGRDVGALLVVEDLFRDDLGRDDLFRVRLIHAGVLKRLGRLDQAVNRALVAWLRAPSDRLAVQAALLLGEMGRPITAVDKTIRELSRGAGKDLKRLAKWVAKRPKEARSRGKGVYEAIQGANALIRKRDSALAINWFTKAIEVGESALLVDYCRNGLAEAHVLADDDEAAARTFTAIADEGCGPFSANSAFSAVRALERLKQYDSAVELLGRFGGEFLSSGLANRAMWERALVYLVAGRGQSALAAVEAVLDRVDVGNGLLYGMAEKARYFRGILLAGMGQLDPAIHDLRRVSRGYPYSYYGVLAVSRLKELEGAEPVPFAELPSADAGTWFGPMGVEPLSRNGHSVRTFPATAVARGPVALWSLGETGSAIAWLKAGSKLGVLTEDDSALLAAMMLQGRSQRVAMATAEYLRGPYRAHLADVFAGAWPRPFAGTVATAMGDLFADFALVYGVMRAESMFNPKAMSGAGARGLMQVMKATGRRIADVLLDEPAIAKGSWSVRDNIRLGAAFLTELTGHFGGHLPLAIAAYNAGAGAARRFRTRLGHLETDVFVEAIPFPATSAYVKSVIGYTSAYRSLYWSSQGPVILPMRIPEKLGPFMDGPLPRRPPQVSQSRIQFRDGPSS